MFQRRDSSRNVCMTWILSFLCMCHSNGWKFAAMMLTMQERLNAVFFLKLSVLCYASYEGTCFCLFSITQRKSTMKLQSSENLYEQFSSRLFHTCNFIMKEEVQFSPTKNSMQVSGWGQKFPTWKFPTWGPLQRSTSFLISQLQPLTPAYE